MRPYLAIISDSFRAAFASRVLWFVLAAILLFLLVLAPFGYREVYTVEFSSGDISSGDRLTRLLGEALTEEGETAAGNVADALPEPIQTSLREARNDPEQGPGRGDMVRALNELIETDEWYNAALWEGTLRLSELRDLDELDAEEMETSLRERRARLRLEAALPGVFRPRPNRSLLITYAWMETPVELPFRKDRFAEVMNTFVLPLILNFLLGVGAVFVGILVTSPIIPEMFQPGSLHLLLSKPISRPALFLSKFIGGCAFVLVCVTLLVSGMWLIAGMRMDIWNIRLYLSIPVFVFLFAVYYSVSSLAGLHWRSAVVSVVVTILFWFACFLVGQIGGVSDAFVKNPARIESLQVGDQSLLGITAQGGLIAIPRDGSSRRTLIESPIANRQRILGPVWLGDGRLATANRSQGGFNTMRSGLRLQIFDPANDWSESEGIELPSGTIDLASAPGGGLLVLTADGLYVAAEDELDVSDEKLASPEKGGLFSGLQKYLGKPKSAFKRVTPATIGFISPTRMLAEPKSGQVFVYSAGTMYRFDTNETDESGSWTVAASTLLDGDGYVPAEIGWTDSRLVVYRRDAPLFVLDDQTLDVLHEIPAPEDRSVVSLVGAADQAAMLMTLSDRTTQRIEWTPEPQVVPSGMPYQGESQAVGWDAEGRAWLAHDIDFLSLVDPDGGSVTETLEPERGLWRNIDAFVITPLRTLVPQTGELGETVVALICGRSDVEFNTGEDTQREKLDVVRPLATCGGFTAFMLFLGCLYVYRQDF